MNEKKKKVFITGIAGFIGMHLALSLKARGDEVIGCDNFHPFYDPALKRLRAEKLSQAGIKVLEKDINEIAEIKESVCACTHLVHLAAQPGVRYSVKHPEVVMDANLNGLIQVLEVIKKTAVELVFASSSSIYGLNEKVPFAETDQTLHQASLYGATKMAGELICHSYHHLYQIPTRMLRFFTVYGPWGRPDMAYFLFAKAIVENRPIEVFNHGKMERDFTYIDDIIDGIIASVDCDLAFEAFNLGNSQTEKLGTLISLLEKNLEKEAIQKMMPMQMGDVTKTSADISKAERLLGFAPKVSLEEGIQRFTKWFKSEIILSRSL